MCTLCWQIMPLADEFHEILDALPSDRTDLEFDLASRRTATSTPRR